MSHQKNGLRDDLKQLLTDDFKNQLKKFEYVESTQDDQDNYVVYLDDRKQARVGHGHLVLQDDNLKVGDLISPEKADKLFDYDLERAVTECQENFAMNWDLIPVSKKQVLIGMHFQLGTFIVNSFVRMRYAVNVQDWQEAGTQILESQWYNETSPYFKYKNASIEWSKIMSYEGKVEELDDEKADITDVLLNMEKSDMNQFYGIKIDSQNQTVKFIGKEMIEYEDDDDDDDNNSNNNSNNNDENKSNIDESSPTSVINDDEIRTGYYEFCHENILSGEATWYHFYTFLLLFYEKGLCDTISFSLDIDGKVDKSQIEPHILKKVYFPESHLRYVCCVLVFWKDLSISLFACVTCTVVLSCIKWCQTTCTLIWFVWCFLLLLCCDVLCCVAGGRRLGK